MARKIISTPANRAPSPAAVNSTSSVAPKDDRGAYLPVEGIPVFAPANCLFKQQLAFVNDPNPFKIAVCSRRAGKTIACAVHLLETALKNKDVVCLYITLSRNNAKKLIWRELLRFNTKYQLGAKPDTVELSLLFPNGSIIYVSGAKDESEIEKFRGLPIKLCYIDECQSFRAYISELIDDVISPALLDYAGDLCLIGTPGPVPAGYFAEVAGVVTEKKHVAESWSHHSWTFFDNPFIEQKSKKTHQELIDRELKRRGVDINDASIQREFFGRWVLDNDSLWIHYDRVLNEYKDMMPNTQYHYIMGIDLGIVDADAIAILAWSDHDPNTYLVEEHVQDGQDLTQLVQQIQYFEKKYQIDKIVCDEGGLGKKLAEEMRRRYGIPIQPADKARKQENVAFLNASLRRGLFRAHSGSKFAQDTYLVEIDRSKSTPDRIRLSDRYHSDIIDAVLYAFKESPAYAYQAPIFKPKYGTKEWADAQQDEMFDAAVDHFQKQADLTRKHNMGDFS